MASSELRIMLGRSDSTYRPGERIGGRVSVTSEQGCRCDKLTIALQWCTHGKGNGAKGAPVEQVLFVGDWRPGETQDYPFDLEAPAGPLTYRGTLLNVDWYLTARADVPWAIDPKAERELLLVPWTEHELGPAAGGSYRTAPVQPWETVAVGPQLQSAEQVQASQAQKLGWSLAAGAVCVVIGVPLVLVAKGSEAYGAVLLVAAAALLGNVLWKWLARRSLGGSPQVRLDPPVAEAGGNVTVEVKFTPSKAISLESATAALSAAEIVVKGSGTDKHTYTQALHAAREPLAESGRRIAAAQRAQLHASFAIPVGAPPSFAATDNEVRWSVEVTVDALRAPAWKLDVPFVVRPRSVGRS
jgi:hypothetical protein